MDQELHFLEGKNNQCNQDEAGVTASLGNAAPTNQGNNVHGPLKQKGSFSEATALENNSEQHPTTSSLRLSALDSQSITVSLSGTGGPQPPSVQQ